MPGPFNLNHLHPFEPLLFLKFQNFFTFILGGQFLLPQRANNGKREFPQLQNWMRQRGFRAWGIQTGPFASLCTFHFLKIFHLFTCGEAISVERRRSTSRFSPPSSPSNYQILPYKDYFRLYQDCPGVPRDFPGNLTSREILIPGNLTSRKI